MSVSLGLPGAGTGSGSGKTAGIDDATASQVADDFAACYQREYPRIVRALELSGAGRPLAEDLAQEAFARALVHWRRVRLGSNPAGYVFTTAFRLARRRHALPQAEQLPGGESGSLRWSAADVADEATVRTVASAVISAMPAGRRSCAVLCLLAGLETREAARALGIKESTVRKQVERARADLRAALGDHPAA